MILCGTLFVKYPDGYVHHCQLLFGPLPFVTMSKAEVLGAHQVDSSEEYIEVWNDLVSPRDLTLSLAICGGVTIAALVLATFLSSSLFFWGLGGSVVGFIICAVAFTPKRQVRIVSANDSTTGPAESALSTSGLGTSAVTGAAH